MLRTILDALIEFVPLDEYLLSHDYDTVHWIISHAQARSLSCADWISSPVPQHFLSLFSLALLRYLAQ